jgi:hypothetical protein
MEGQQQAAAQQVSNTNATAAALVAEGLSEGKNPPATDAAATTGKDALKPGEGQSGSSVTTGQPGKKLELTQEELDKLIDARVARAVEAGNKALSEEQTRSRFLIQKMGDVPVEFHALMPKSGDLKVLAQAEQDLRGAMQSWFKKNMDEMLTRRGHDPKKFWDVGGVMRDGGDGNRSYPVSQVTASTATSPQQLVAEGLREGEGQRR